MRLCACIFSWKKFPISTSKFMRWKINFFEEDSKWPVVCCVS